MKFGTSYEDIKKEPSGGGGGSFIKYLKLGDTKFRILQEPKDWKGYWEHSNYGHGYPFPCTGERETCPGCTSDLETRKSAGRKILLQVLETATDKDGKVKTDDKGQPLQYVNLYKVSRDVADKLDNRAQRIAANGGSITDREFVITRFKNGPKNTDVATDIDSLSPEPIDLTKFELIDHEAMLQAAYDDVWGDNPKDDSKIKSKAAEAEDEADSTPTSSESTTTTEASEPKTVDVDAADEVERMRRKIAELEAGQKSQAEETVHPDSPRAATGSVEDPPSEPEAKNDPVAEGEDDVVYTPEQLKAMTKAQLLTLILKEQESGGLPKNDDVKSMTKVELLKWLFDALGSE